MTLKKEKRWLQAIKLFKENTMPDDNDNNIEIAARQAAAGRFNAITADENKKLQEAAKGSSFILDDFNRVRGFLDCNDIQSGPGPKEKWLNLSYSAGYAVGGGVVGADANQPRIDVIMSPVLDSSRRIMKFNHNGQDVNLYLNNKGHICFGSDSHRFVNGLWSNYKAEAELLNKVLVNAYQRKLTDFENTPADQRGVPAPFVERNFGHKIKDSYIIKSLGDFVNEYSKLTPPPTADQLNTFIDNMQVNVGGQKRTYYNEAIKKQFIKTRLDEIAKTPDANDRETEREAFAEVIAHESMQKVLNNLAAPHAPPANVADRTYENWRQRTWGRAGKWWEESTLESLGGKSRDYQGALQDVFDKVNNKLGTPEGRGALSQRQEALRSAQQAEAEPRRQLQGAAEEGEANAANGPA